MPAEPETRTASSLLLTVIAALALPVCYVLSWGPVPALARRWDLACEPLQIVYFPIGWVAWNCPGAYEPLKWYWERFDSLRLGPHDRARQLIYTTSSTENETDVAEDESQDLEAGVSH